MSMKPPNPVRNYNKRSKGEPDDVSFLGLYLFVGFYVIMIILAFSGAFDKIK